MRLPIRCVHLKFEMLWLMHFHFFVVLSAHQRIHHFFLSIITAETKFVEIGIKWNKMCTFTV